jgi:hypothetical protein
MALAFVLGSSAQADTYTSDEVLVRPTRQAFSVCSGHSCKYVAQLSLPPSAWQTIEDIFSEAPVDAEAERRLIARAIAYFENLVGSMTNTSGDKGRNLSGNWAESVQMDCIDESTNTSTYLKILQHEGLLHWHRAEDRATRGYFFFGWPHTTAVIRDTRNNKKYAIDSWFHDNGIQPEIIELEIWRQGWEP